MSNVLSDDKKQQVIALGKLGWPLRRIEQATGVRRETASSYLKAAGIGVRPARGWGRRPPAKPANEVTTNSDDSKPANEPGVPPIYQAFFAKTAASAARTASDRERVRGVPGSHRTGAEPRTQCGGDLAGSRHRVRW
jgi:hypothetical protein